MSRPKGCIYPNCLNCPLPECEYDGIEIEDEAISNAIDREIKHIRVVENHYSNGTYSTYASKRRYFRSEKGKNTVKRYFKSDKGKEAQKRYSRTLRGQETQRRYLASYKGKMAQKRYLDSDKGKEALKRKAQKDIASGKNAEKCKRYYERHRAEILAKAKAKREAMKI